MTCKVGVLFLMEGKVSQREGLGISTDYGAAKLALAVLDILAWIMVILGGIWSTISLFALIGGFLDERHAGNIIAGLISLAPALGLLVGGFLIIAHGQLVHASIDTADYNREMLELMQRQSERTTRG